MARLLGLLVLVLLLDRCQTDEKVSFYGASYIHLSVQEAKSATDISFKFRTHLADAMLLLAAGRTDYCLIKLESGRLKVHINLGAGEKELSSARELQLNDLSWHEVNLTRRDANIVLKIDVIHSTSDTLPGRFFELNINFGVYIGGQGGFNELFLGHTEYLRGCMADVIYNGIRVVDQARHRNSSEATAVSWGCSAEFDTGSKAEISFVEDGAFTAFPRTIPRSGSRWELEMKTVSQTGLLLFNAGQSSHADFLGVELVDSKIRILMNKGNGPTELIHKVPVGDGIWHHVQLDFSPYFIGISVDGEAQNMSLPSGNRFLDLADTLYIGGAELNKRAKALTKGIKSGDVSYKGCIRNMMLDNQDLSLAQVKISQGLVVNCVWGFPCAEAEPCVPGAMCSQLGVRSFKCTCDQKLCIKSNFTEEYKYKYNTNLPVSLEILSLRPINVDEGKRATLGERHINIILDIARFGLNESSVMLAVLTPPIRGTLHLDKAPIIAGKTRFTLYDVYQHRVTYHHDGSESLEDSAIMKIALAGSSGRSPLPGYFQDSLRFTLPVNVTPVNDPPQLELNANNSAAALRLAQGTRKTLTRDLVWTHDTDTPDESLVYTVFKNDTDLGFIERLPSPGASSGQQVNKFTQAELVQGLIDYVHTGKSKTKASLVLKVSDGMSSSGPQTLRITTYPLSVWLKVTGLVVVHNSFSLLTPSNISYTTNAEDPRVDLRYNLVGQPKYGVIERQREPHLPWISTDHFYSQDLERQAVRYLHKSGTPHQDSFSFTAAVHDLKLPSAYEFKVNFITLELREIRRSSINFTNSAEVIVDNTRLQFQTNPLITDTKMIVYSLLEGPRYGNVYINHEKLKVGQTFTQKDIDDYGRFRYRHLRRAYSPIEDVITFKVTASQCSDVTTSLNFFYHPSDSIISERVENFHVVEGGRTPLRVTRMNYHDFGVTTLNFNVTEKARHGYLTVYNNSIPVRYNTTYFSSEELAHQAVFYVHDDSETTNDSLEFLAISSDHTDFMFVGAIYIEIDLKNDKKPVRMNRKIFHVVSKAEKLITNADLLFTDEDLNTKPASIVYNVKQISNGKIFRIDEPMYQINQFSQQDIDDEKILFKHHGDNYGRIDFQVSDGELRTDDDLEIQAGHAYVKLLLSDGTVVQSNRTVALTTKEIEVETNVYANASDVGYTVIEKPKYGVLLKFNQEISSFDKEDLLHKLILYKHIGLSLKTDQFKLRVNVRGAEDTGSFTVKVFPEIFWEPLTIFHNSSIYVEEATSVILSRKNLEIGHPDIPTSNIIYYIKEWPKNGYLEVQSFEEFAAEEDEDFHTHLLTHFEQNLINEGRVYYVQSRPNQTHDKFVVDVTNSISWLRNLMVNIVIEPDKLYVGVRNLTVPEGKSVILHESDFYAETSYFAGKITDYKVKEKPKHGTIVDAKQNHVKKFTYKQLSNQEILYKNHGDEVPTDYFEMVVKAGEKSSEPFKVWINVLPINDEKPIVVNKTKFSVWQGGSVIINNEMLAAIDNDTQPTDLIYDIKNIVNGYFSLDESPAVEIRNFSQEMINTGKILFTHTNGSEAEFSFIVNDELHTTDINNVIITTKSVKIKIERNKGLKMFPLTRTTITNELLLSKCSDMDRDVRYFIRSRPNMGVIMMETSDGIWSGIDRFTQKDLNNSRIFYEHNKQFNNLSAVDSFIFDVETYHAASIKNQLFKIDISVSSGGLHRYVTVTPIKVKEGEHAYFSVNISGIVNYIRTKAAINNPDISLRLIKQPNFGHVMLDPDVNITIFSQSEAESNKMLYYHDDSDTLKDQIDFIVYFHTGQVNLCNISVPVDIEPKNDQPFKTQIINGIHIVQNQTQTITRNDLLTTDPDTEPKDIVYKLLHRLECGRLLLLSSDSNSEIRDTVEFTQEDIDSSRLILEHKGNLSISSVYFQVSDGQFKPKWHVFNIYVYPIKINFTVLKPVEIQQGQSSTVISTESIKLDTNVRQELIFYEVTESPKHGVLHIRNQSSSFKHIDLLSKIVMYEQKDMTYSEDSIEVAACVSDFKLPNIVIPIKATPLIIMNSNLQVYAGNRTKLSISNFDATPLQRLSGSDPVFKIIRKPSYAKIMRIMNRSMSSGDKRGSKGKEISKFTHSEIQSGFIFLVCKSVPTDDINGAPDSFEFILAVPQNPPRFQPAVGVFDFHVKLAFDYYNNSLDGPLDPVGYEGRMPIAPNMTDDYSPILGMLLGVFCLGICLIVTIRCNQNTYKDTEEEDEEDDEDEEDEYEDKVEPASPSIMPLPRPPDHLLPVTPHLKRYTNDHHNNSLTSTPLPPMMPTLTSTLPQCKVIPLSPMENMTGSEMDVSVRYPYGMPDTDEWSSFDTTELPCPSQTSQPRTTPNPLLRRNQYWV